MRKGRLHTALIGRDCWASGVICCVYGPRTSQGRLSTKWSEWRSESVEAVYGENQKVEVEREKSKEKKVEEGSGVKKNYRNGKRKKWG